MYIQEASEYLGVHPQTLRRWEREGRITPKHTPGGRRVYTKDQLDKLIPETDSDTDTRQTIGYCRVSTPEQKEDLQRQAELITLYCASNGWEHSIITDTGSGLNYHKKGLQELIKLIDEDQVARIVLTYKDRLLRFGNEILEYLCELHGTEIIVINNTEDKTYEQELVDDALSVIIVFSSRMYGENSHKAKRILNDNKELFAREEAR